jgi:rhodanese-related sulfurtransferase
MTDGQETKPELPEMKQTSLGLYVTAKEAYEKWQADPEKVKILDVRTPEEYIYVGHAEMAWNIPLAFQAYQWDAAKGYFAFKPNPDFMALVKEQFAPEDTLLITCRSGGRSAMAVNGLAKMGYTNVFNITDGMEGDCLNEPGSPEHGKRTLDGWKNSGAPWTYDINPDQVRLPTE